jgi:hypothetical protein
MHSHTIHEIKLKNKMITLEAKIFPLHEQSYPNFTLPHWSSTYRHQMAAEVTKLNVGVPQMTSRWQEMPIQIIRFP